MSSNSNDENTEAVEILLRSRYEHLNDWETNFLEDIQVRLEAGKGLTPGQQIKLDEIFERRMK